MIGDIAGCVPRARIIEAQGRIAGGGGRFGEFDAGAMRAELLVPPAAAEHDADGALSGMQVAHGRAERDRLRLRHGAGRRIARARSNRAGRRDEQRGV